MGMGGLTFEQVLARAKAAFKAQSEALKRCSEAAEPQYLRRQGGIHLSNPQPPASSSKLVVNKLAMGSEPARGGLFHDAEAVGDAKVDVWCQHIA